MRTIIIVQEVEVHGWLLSGSEEDYRILCCSFLTLVANKQQALWCKAKSYCRLNRKFVRTDDTTQDSEETATAFTVSQSSHNSRTKLQFANPRIKIQENVARSLQKLLIFVALQPLSSYSWNRQTDTHTHTRLASRHCCRRTVQKVLARESTHVHTHSQLYRLPRAATPRDIRYLACPCAPRHNYISFHAGNPSGSMITSPVGTTTTGSFRIHGYNYTMLSYDWEVCRVSNQFSCQSIIGRNISYRRVANWKWSSHRQWPRAN